MLGLDSSGRVMNDSWSEMVVMGMTLTQKTKKRGAMMKTRVEATMDGGINHHVEVSMDVIKSLVSSQTSNQNTKQSPPLKAWRICDHISKAPCTLIPGQPISPCIQGYTWTLSIRYMGTSQCLIGRSVFEVKFGLRILCSISEEGN